LSFRWVLIVVVHELLAILSAVSERVAFLTTLEDCFNTVGVVGAVVLDAGLFLGVGARIRKCKHS